MEEMLNLSEPPTMNIIITIVVGSFAVAQEMSQFKKLGYIVTLHIQRKLRLLVENPWEYFSFFP